jgi:hypothetical protein
MAKITLQIQGQSLDLNVALNLADSDLPRILNWLQSAESGYGKIKNLIEVSSPNMSWVPKVGQTEADRPLITSQKWDTRQATAEEAIESYANALLNNMLLATVSWEKTKAAEQAANAIQPINAA